MTTKGKIFILAALASAVACTVKEDRTECPCWVSVKTETQRNGVVSFYNAASLEARRTIDAEHLTSGDNRTQVSKGDNLASVVTGCDDMDFTKDDTTVRCTPGKGSGEIWAFAKRFDARGDEAFVEDVLHKQYAKIDFTFVHSGKYPYDVTLTAACDGINLTDLRGTSGTFVVALALDSLNRCSVRVPRQRTHSDIVLRMSLEGREKGLMNLSKYFLAAAYSWESADLEDIAVTIDFASMTIAVRVGDWDVKILKIEI